MKELDRQETGGFVSLWRIAVPDLMTTAVPRPTAFPAVTGSAPPRSGSARLPVARTADAVAALAVDIQAVPRADALDRDGDGIACPALPGPKDRKPVPRDYTTDLDGAPIVEPIAPPSP